MYKLNNYNKNNNYKVFLTGALIGSIVFIAIYGIGVLNPTNDWFAINGYVEKDLAQHYAGWMLYRQSPWTFPLGVGSHIAYPFGNSVSYTDSIPLFAIFFKFLSPILPQTFQYFGIFVFLSFVLQGGFAALIANLFTKNSLSIALISLLFCFTPIMIERAFRHVALSAHFLILACIYYYFKNKNETNITSYLPFFLINILAITIHPYFLPFTFGIMFAFCLERFFKKEHRIQSAVALLISIIITLIVGYCIGAFYVSGDMSNIGYGYYAMNLNALFNPISRGFENWSSVINIRPLPLGNIEAFNYLGFGVLSFILPAIAFLFLKENKYILLAIKKFLKNNFGLIFSLTVLTIFAIGDIIRYCELEIFKIPYPQELINGIFGIFRANGRFGNLLVYLIMIFIVYTICLIDKKQIRNILLLTILLLQIVDMRGVLLSKANYFRNGIDNQNQYANQYLSNNEWDKLISNIDELYILDNTLGNGCIDITIKCAKNNIKVYSGFEARTNAENFETLKTEKRNEILSGNISENTAYLDGDLTVYKDLIDSEQITVLNFDGQNIIISNKNNYIFKN